MLKVVKRLLDTGVSLQNIRVAVEHLRGRGVEDLAGVTLFSDGTTVYECTSPEEIVDLLQGGQGVFGIAVGGTMREVTGSLAEFPAERVDGDRLVEVAQDELARRRQARIRGLTTPGAACGADDLTFPLPSGAIGAGGRFPTTPHGAPIPLGRAAGSVGPVA